MIHLGGDVDQKALLWWFMFPICMVNFLLNLKLYPLSKVKLVVYAMFMLVLFLPNEKNTVSAWNPTFPEKIWSSQLEPQICCDMYIYIYTLWLFNVAMAIDGPFMDDFPTKTPMKNRDFPRLCWITRWYIYIYIYIPENLSLPVFCHIPNISKSPNSNQVSSPTLPFAIHLVFPLKRTQSIPHPSTKIKYTSKSPK